MPELSTIAVCPKCGYRLPKDTPEGLCVKCVFETVLAGAVPLTPPSGAGNATLPRAFGEYELLEEIARGGMGIVYRARQKRLNRLVALKVIRDSQFASSQARHRFQIEAEAAAELDHPNIVPIYEFGSVDGHPFLSMKLVEGASLASQLRSAPMEEDRLARITTVLAHAIHFAHQHGIIHRDLKPGNVLLDSRDQPQVTDFGVAKRMDPDASPTQTDDVIGSPNYMAPEQAAGRAYQVTTAADVYSLGAIMYELLTGQLPFRAPTALETMRKVREEEPVAPRLLNKFANHDLETICLKCMEKEPARRYGSAMELAEDLERWQRREPILARPSPPAERLAKWVRRRPLAAALSTITLLAVAASVAILIRANIQSHAAERKQTALRQLAENHEQVARQRAYASDMNLARQALTENNLGRARELLGRQRPTDGQSDLRGWEWRYLWQQCGSDALFSLTREEGSIAELAVSPDGRWLAVGGAGGGRLTVWDFAERREVKRLADGVTSLRAAFSPKEPVLAYATSFVRSNQTIHRVRLWNPATQANVLQWHLPGACNGLAFSEDGRALLTAIDEPDARLISWDVSEGTMRSSLPTAPLRRTVGTPFAASRDLRWVASAHGDAQLRVTDMHAGRVAWETSKPGFTVNSVAIDPSQTVLAAAFQHADSFIQLYRLATGEELGQFPIRNGYVICLRFSSDGKTLIAAGSNQTITSWDVGERRVIATLQGHSWEVWRLALFPDGKTAVSGSGDGEVLAWDLRGSGTKECVTLPVASRFCWRFTPTSDAIITCELDGDVTRWKGPEFQESQRLLRVGDGPSDILLSEDCGTVVASFANGIIRVWNLKDGSLRRELSTGGGAAVVWGLADGAERLLVVNEREQSLHEWNLRSGVEQPVAADLADWPIRGAFPHGSRQRHAGLAIKRKLDAAPKSQRLPERVTRLFAGVFSQDHRYFAQARPVSLVEVEDGESGALLGEVRGFLQGVHSLAFSPDRRRLAVGSDDRQAVKLWDLDSFQELVTLRGSDTSYSQTRFSPDGNLLGTMNYRGVLHVWQAPTWTEIEATERADGTGGSLRTFGSK